MPAPLHLVTRRYLTMSFPRLTVAAAFIALITTACGGGYSSPSSPSPTSRHARQPPSTASAVTHPSSTPHHLQRRRLRHDCDCRSAGSAAFTPNPRALPREAALSGGTTTPRCTTSCSTTAPTWECLSWCDDEIDRGKQRHDWLPLHDPSVDGRDDQRLAAITAPSAELLRTRGAAVRGS
jgi:hypothetical protein